MSKKKKILFGVLVAILVLAGILLCLFLTGGIANAAGLVDETANAENLWSKYGLKNYQLDFYVSTSGGWLPWNWGDSIGKSVMYGLYLITNGLWMVSVNISSITGSVIAEVYQLDFVGSVAETLGGNLQTIAGVSTGGFSSDGLYVKLLPWFIILTGASVAWFGLVKHESSKALNVFLNFVLTFAFSAAFIAYSPDYISSINEFSTELSTSMLDIGTKVLMPESDREEKSSVDIMRDNLFTIQVYKPWLLLQYGTMDVDTIGQERIDNLLSVSPSEGENREDKVIEEVEDNSNMNMSITEVTSRFGSVLLMLVINVVISIFVMLLTGVMLLSQLFFIMFCLALPISFLISMIPGQGSKWKQAVEKVFNTIMMRAGISFIITIAFCLSSMVYGLTEDKPFLLIGILQILVYIGVFVKMRELLGVMSIQGNNEGGFARRMFYRPYMYGRRFMRRHSRGRSRIQTSERMVSDRGNGGENIKKTLPATGQNTNRMIAQQQEYKRDKTGMGERAGNALGKGIGAISDIPARVTDTAKKPFEKVRDLPTNAKYAAYSVGKGFKDEREQSKQNRQDRQERRKNTKEYKCMQMSGESGINVSADNNKPAGQEVKKNIRKQGEFDYKKDKGASGQQKGYDVGKFPRGAALNTSKQEKRENDMQYHAPLKTAGKTPTFRENRVRKELNVAPRENGRNSREVTSGRKEFQLRTKTNDMGKLPEGATLNYQRVNRRSEKEMRKGRKG